MDALHKPRSKAFISLDSLWYEEERLATFIEWPVQFISSYELAREGFYYLRTKDHCACAFCRGIIGAWEKGDTPRGEHKRHFPQCSFVQGKVTPNVPLKQGHILSRVCLEITADVGSSKNTGEDVCGNGKKTDLDPCPEGRVLTKSSSTELSMSSLGFRQYCGPKRKDFLTIEARFTSFKHWPEKVTQSTKELAEAGFYYRGLSDHVSCFHCGNGLRNWETSDKPWEEHARWFPDCHFVLLKKGIEFIDKVRRERPPYIPVRTANRFSNGTPSLSSAELSDDDLENLMELEIMRHVLEMGFSKDVVRTALRKKVIETGHPFFTIDTCIDAIFSAMETETKSTIEGCEDITSQARTMASYEASSRVQTTQIPSPSFTRTSPSEQPRRPRTLSEPDLEPSPNTELPPLPNRNSTTIPPTSLPPLPNISRAPPPLRSSTPTSQMEGDDPERVEGDVPPQRMEVEESANEGVELSSPAVSVVEEGLDTENNLRDSNAAPTELVPNVSQSHEEATLSMELPNEVVPLISEADDIMEEAAKLLYPPSSSSVSSQSTTSSSSLSFSHSTTSSSLNSSQELENVDKTPSNVESGIKSSEEKQEKVAPNTENLALELERMREDQMCKVCMDSKMDVVFLPCTHMVTCSSCAVALAACPICRREIQYAFKPIIP